MREVYSITGERKVFIYNSGISLRSLFFRAMFVAIYSCHSLQNTLCSLVACAIWAEADSAIMVVGWRHGLIGGRNEMPVVVKYIAGVTERARRLCMPSPRFEKIDAAFALILRWMAARVW